MREIKFRAWDKDRKKMVYKCEYLPPFKCNEKEDIWIMQQYTGLKDKNGKEIYEGDIILTDTPVIWKEHSSGGGHGFFGIETGKYPLSEYSHHDDFEVTGNIYENPELLKEALP